jgi:hypothetical protein
MMSLEERVCMAFLDKMHDHGGRHVKRLGPSVGPLVWKISQLPGVQWEKRYSRQMGFSYRDRYFKGRYTHSWGGRLEVVELLGREDGSVVVIINGLDEAMTLDLQSKLDVFIG